MFCKNCGDVLTDTEVVCCSCGFAIGTGANYCEQCGAETPSYAVVCELCGKEIVRESEDDTPIAMQYAQEPTCGGYAQAYQQQPQPQPQQQDFRTYTPNYSAANQNQASTEGIWMEDAQNRNGRKSRGSTGLLSASPKSKSTYVLLGLLLGAFGAHDFYIGKTKKGLIHVGMSIFGFGLALSWMWAVFEIFIQAADPNAKDGNGNLLE